MEKWKGLVPFMWRIKGCPKVLRKIMHGFTIHEIDLDLKRAKGNLDHLFMLVVFGDLVGLLLLPPYYSLRILPHIIPTIDKWKRSLLKEKDLTDFVSVDI
jgi:hypothetical protein